MRKLLFILCILMSNTAFGQEIHYYFPDDVEKALYNWAISCKDLTQDHSLYLCLYKFHKEEREGYYYALCCSFIQKEGGYSFLSTLVKTTKRKAVVNNLYIPLLLDYDLFFGTPKDESKIGPYGAREGTIQRCALIFDGYSIEFTSDGIIREGYF